MKNSKTDRSWGAKTGFVCDLDTKVSDVVKFSRLHPNRLICLREFVVLADESNILRMKLFLSILLLSFIFLVQAHADAPECDREDVEFHWENAIPRVFEAIVIHIEDYRKSDSNYEGYPDLACFTELYFSLDTPSDTEVGTRVGQLLDLEVESIYRDLVENTGDPGTFVYEIFFEEVLCVAQQLGRLSVDYSACSGEMAKTVTAIKSNYDEADKERGVKDDGNEKGPDVVAGKDKIEVTPDYHPLLRRGTAGDESFCKRAFHDKSRWHDGDPNKQVDLEHCWDFTSLGGEYYYGLDPVSKEAESLKGQYTIWNEFGTPTKIGLYILARAKRVGRGTRSDLRESIELYQRAARAGCVKAQYFMGLFYAEGHGVTQDYNEAEKWLRRAVKWNDADAKAYLGYLLEFGIGVMENRTEALQLYREAAISGQPFARTRFQALSDNQAYRNNEQHYQLSQVITNVASASVMLN